MKGTPVKIVDPSHPHYGEVGVWETSGKTACGFKITVRLDSGTSCWATAKQIEPIEESLDDLCDKLFN
jgi:hypothetical protein